MPLARQAIGERVFASSAQRRHCDNHGLSLALGQVAIPVVDVDAWQKRVHAARPRFLLVLWQLNTDTKAHGLPSRLQVLQECKGLECQVVASSENGKLNGLTGQHGGALQNVRTFAHAWVWRA